MKSCLRLLPLLLSASIMAPAPARADCGPADDACWRREHAELCKYDSLCTRLVEGDEWKRPKWEVIESLKEFGPKIRELAKKYDVDPRAVAGAIFAENSLNVTKADEFQGWLVKMKIAKAGKIPIWNRSFSFGWGQLYVEAAMLAEPFVAKMQGRDKPRTPDEVGQALTVPEESVHYIAGLMRYIQDVYKRNGYDVSGKPEILTTLYNIGRTEDLVAKTKASGRQPRPNFFGFFVDHYMPDLEKAIGYEAPGSDAGQEVAQAPAAATPEGTPVSAPAAPEEKAATVKVMTRALQLHRSPPRCSDDSSSKEAEYNKIRTYEKAEPLAQIPAHTVYREVSPGLGCRMDGDQEAWTLISGENGSVGWVRGEDLANASGDLVRHEKDCVPGPSEECKGKVQAKAGPLALSSSGSEVQVKFNTTGDASIPVHWGSPVLACQNSEASGSFGAYPYAQSILNTKSGTHGYSFRTVADEKLVAKALELAAALRFRAQEALGLTDEEFKSTKNPYHSLFNGDYAPVPKLASNLFKCISSPDGSPEQNCFLSEDPSKIWSSLKFPKEPTYTQWKAVMDAVTPTYGTSPYTPPPGKDPPKEQRRKEAEKVAERRKALLDKLKPCEELVKGYKKAQEMVDRIRKLVEAMTIRSPLMNYAFGIDQANGRCLFVKQVMDESGSSCPQCSSYYMGGLKIDFSTLKPLLKSTEDKDAFLVDFLKEDFYDNQIRNMAGSSGQFSGSYACGGYQPFETAKQISQLLSEPCVKVIYVPDPWLLRKLSGAGKRLIYRPFIEEDRYAVELAESGCEGGKP